jgi:chorismate mutase/prephenate dehydratase
MEDSKRLRKELKDIRKNIDNIDNSIISLLNERGKAATRAGKIKNILGLKVSQPEREREIIERIKNLTTTLKPSSMVAIWKEIMSACKVIQGSILKVGFLGPVGTFSHQAAHQFFPKAGTDFIDCYSIAEIFESIEKDNINFGVVPIENSLYGTVRETLDLLIEKDLIIYGEFELRVVHNLIGLKNSNLNEIKSIYSHPQAFAQTKIWIKSILPSVKLINAQSTAEAVLKIIELKDITIAAIGTDFACNMYDLKVLASKIEDDPQNITRFLLISKKENSSKKEKMKTSIVYVTKHVPGALYRVLKCFSDENVNLLKIESRPRRKGKWEYIFLMDFEGDKDSEKIRRAIKIMNENVIWFKILGTYPIP